MTLESFGGARCSRSRLMGETEVAAVFVAAPSFFLYASVKVTVSLRKSVPLFALLGWGAERYHDRQNTTGWKGALADEDGEAATERMGASCFNGGARWCWKQRKSKEAGADP